MNSTAPQKTTNLVDLISEGKNNEVDLSTTSYPIRVGDIITMAGSVFDSYMSFLEESSVVVKFTPEEQAKYKNDPKLLSLDLYGTLDLWFILLKLNRCSSLFGFKFKSVTVIHPKKLDVISKVMSLCEERLKKAQMDAYEE